VGPRHLAYAGSIQHFHRPRHGRSTPRNPEPVHLRWAVHSRRRGYLIGKERLTHNGRYGGQQFGQVRPAGHFSWKQLCSAFVAQGRRDRGLERRSLTQSFSAFTRVYGFTFQSPRTKAPLMWRYSDPGERLRSPPGRSKLVTSITTGRAGPRTGDRLARGD
jgi:hypothetical protein